MDQGSSSPYAPLFGLLGALVGGLVLGGLLEALGARPARAAAAARLGLVDGARGAVLAVAVALGLVWLAGAVALQTPGARTWRTTSSAPPSCGR